MWVIKHKYGLGYLKRGGLQYSKVLPNAMILKNKYVSLHPIEQLVEVELNDKGNYRLKRGDPCLVERKKKL